MAYTNENLSEAKSILTTRRASAEAQARKRLAEVYEKLPSLKELDAKFPEIGAKIISVFSDSSVDKEKAIASLRSESEALTVKREEILKSAGYPTDYTSAKYFCQKCGDKGYTDGKMCQCMKKELTKLGFKSSGLGALLEKQTFDNFSLDYYDGGDKETMRANLEICKGYAKSFNANASSLLMIGGTGLGKTHLSTAIAREVIEKGFDVQYVTAQGLISDFNLERFHKSFSDNQSKTDRYFECELLIIDDFGTEENTQFSAATFYNLINTRTSRSLPTIINTNIRQNAIVERYTERVASRLFGEYTVLLFPGKDVRMQRLMR